MGFFSYKKWCFLGNFLRTISSQLFRVRQKQKYLDTRTPRDLFISGVFLNGGVDLGEPNFIEKPSVLENIANIGYDLIFAIFSNIDGFLIKLESPKSTPLFQNIPEMKRSRGVRMPRYFCFCLTLNSCEDIVLRKFSKKHHFLYEKNPTFPLVRGR